MFYIHVKTGKIYRLLAYATNCTNAQDGELMAVYCPNDNGSDIYVREIDEFNEAFTLIGDEIE